MTILINILIDLLLVVLLVLAIAAIFSRRVVDRVEKGMPPRGQFIEVPGARLHYRELGQGPAILLVHGLAGQMANWDYGVVDALAKDHRVIVVDRPGSGYSVREESAGADLPAQAAMLAALIDGLKLGKVLVAGHSLGGGLALTLALQYPDKIAGLALVAPVTTLMSEVPAAFRALTIASPFLRKVFSRTLLVPMTIMAGKTVLGQVFGPEPVPADFATRGGGLHSLRPSQYIAATRDLRGLADSLPAVEARYGDLRLPVHVLYGDGDMILDWKLNGQALPAKVAGATLQVLEGRGHMLPVTAPEATAAFIEGVAKEVFPAA